MVPSLLLQSVASSSLCMREFKIFRTFSMCRLIFEGVNYYLFFRIYEDKLSRDVYQWRRSGRVLETKDVEGNDELFTLNFLFVILLFQQRYSTTIDTLLMKHCDLMFFSFLLLGFVYEPKIWILQGFENELKIWVRPICA